MKLNVCNAQGAQVSTLDVSDYVWAVPMNEAVLHQAVVAQLANKRHGTHDTMRRSDKWFSARKLRPQKGGGRARLGRRGSPTAGGKGQTSGGAVAHGPHPRSYRQRLPRKMKQLALRVALSEKARSDRLIILDGLVLDGPKTRDIVDILGRLGVRGSTLIVTKEADAVLRKSIGNLQDIDSILVRLLNPLQTHRVRTIVMTQDAVNEADELWGHPKTRHRTPYQQVATGQRSVAQSRAAL